METLVRAFDFAARKHKSQKRKDAALTPYINHPIEVCHLLSSNGVSDLNILIAAILHDTVEDTNTTLDEINNLFGSEVAKIVREVTDDKSLPKEERKQLQIEHATTASLGAKLVKLADKYSNLKDLYENPPTSWNKDEIKGYMIWCYAVFLNLKGVCPPLEAKLEEIFKNAGVFNIEEKDLQIELEHYYKNIKSSE